MKFGKTVAFFIAATLGSACSSSPPSPVDSSFVDPQLGGEHAARRNSTDTVQKLVVGGDIEGLSQLARTVRQSRARTESGLWALGLFHANVQFQINRQLTRGRGCTSPHARLVRDWLKEDPKEPAAVITAAYYELRRAWCERGGDYASNTTRKELEKFSAGANRAYAILDANREMAQVDPEYYAVSAEVYRAIGASKAQLQALLDEAAMREPYYMRTYFAAADSYLPKWGGSYHELDEFARYAAERTETSDKNSFYFRIYWSMEECGCAPPWKTGDWEFMKEAMQDLYDRYPSDHNVDHIIEVSCRASDFDEALRYLRKKHPESTSDDDFVAIMGTCKAQAQGLV